MLEGSACRLPGTLRGHLRREPEKCVRPPPPTPVSLPGSLRPACPSSRVRSASKEPGLHAWTERPGRGPASPTCTRVGHARTGRPRSNPLLPKGSACPNRTGSRPGPGDPCSLESCGQIPAPQGIALLLPPPPTALRACSPHLDCVPGGGGGGLHSPAPTWRHYTPQCPCCPQLGPKSPAGWP